MEKTQLSAPVGTALLVSLLMGLIALGVYYWTGNRLAGKQDAVVKRADSLHSANRRLKENVEELRNQLTTTEADNVSLNEQMRNLNELLTQNYNQLRVMRSGNANRLRSLRLQDRQLVGQRDSIAEELDAMRKKADWLNQSNELVISQKNELQQTLRQRDQNLLTMVPRSAITADAFLVEILKPNEKITAKAKKTDALTVSLSIPAELRLDGLQEVYLSLTDEQQKAMVAPLRKITVSLGDTNEVVPVHAVRNVNFAKNPQRISFSLNPNADIEPGIYRASVYTKDAYIGSAEFRLRDSFWFF